MNDDNAESGDVDLHRSEQLVQDRIPRTADDGRDVIAERNISMGKGIIVSVDNSFIGPFKDGHRKKNEGQAQLNSVIFPFEIRTKRRGNITIRSNTRFYWEDEEIHVRAKNASIDGDGRIRVDFTEAQLGTPRRTWTMGTDDIAQLIESEQWRSDKETDENAREALESFREPADD